MNPIILQLIIGIYYDNNSTLKILKRDWDVVIMIFNIIKKWKKCILESNKYILNSKDKFRVIDKCYESIGYVRKIPDPIGLNINMMPIIMGNNDSIPHNCKQYIEIINECIERTFDEKGKIGYLTIHESFIEKDKTQRRPGWHTESFDQLNLGNGSVIFPIHWGGMEGGIFMMSSIDDSCELYNCYIDDNCIGPLGSIEHMKYDIEKERNIIKTSANELIWITDRTPHRSVPLKQGQYRQFFRLVTSNVSIWYENHSTTNPLGILPGPNTKIVTMNKFHIKK